MLLEQIIKGCKSGDRKAQEQLYATFASRLFGVCLRYASDHSEAEDMMQNGFIRIFRSIHKYKGEGAFEGWLVRVMVNQAIDQYRRRLKIDHVHIDEPEAMELVQELHDPMDIEHLLHMITSLPEKYRLVFNLYAIEGFSHQEIAQKLNITEGTSKSQLSRARKWLREKIQNEEIRL